MYFRKILGKRLLAGVFAPKGGSMQGSVRGRATAHDFLAYLADRQEFDEALDISQVRGRQLSQGRLSPLVVLGTVCGRWVEKGHTRKSSPTFLQQ